MLKKLENKMAYAKVGIYGSAGSGKSRTAAEIAIGLHKKIGSNKPIAVFDTEPAFSWLKPLFDKNEIEVLIADESRALLDLQVFMNEAEKVADIAIIDSITHVWRDAQDSYLDRLNKQRKSQGKKPLFALEFQHWKPIKAQWGDFTDRFLSSKMHVIVCGRAGTVYEYQDKDDGSGKKELISTGTKMATEKELGYEPSLLIEMTIEKLNGKPTNVAHIVKDRADSINGMDIPLPNFSKLSKHFEMLNIGGEHFDSMEKRNSQPLYEGYDETSGWEKEKHLRTIYSEEIIEEIKKNYPSQSNDDKQKRAEIMEKYFGTRSWTKISEDTQSDVLKYALEQIRNDSKGNNNGINQ